MNYRVDFTAEALTDADRLKRDEPKAYKKFLGLLKELDTHPEEGTGHPEMLKNYPPGSWSRRISKKHRLVYRIYNENVVVVVIAAYGHYGDK